MTDIRYKNITYNFILLYVFSCELNRKLQIYSKIALILSLLFNIFNLDLKTVISDLENPPIHILYNLTKKTSNLVNNSRHIISISKL